jgi:hypothetical protein
MNLRVYGKNLDDNFKNMYNKSHWRLLYLMSYVSNLIPYITDILPMSLNFGCRDQGKVWNCLEVHKCRAIASLDRFDDGE